MCLPKQNRVLDDAILAVWDALDKTCKIYASKDRALQYHGDRDLFFDKFKQRYKEINKIYMKPGVKELDRHKVIAAMIVSFIECDFLSYLKKGSNIVFLAPEMITLEVGLNWMLMGLNDELSNAGVTEQIAEYVMPHAFACPTPYFEILARNLYYARIMGPGLNPLDLSEKLFLLEYITLLSNDISPETLSYKK